MIRKLPIIGASAAGGDIIYAASRAFDVGASDEFASAMSAYARLRRVYLTDSGIAAFYLILRALSDLSPGTEVVLPAYTAGSLVVAVRKAGLKPVLCDISLDDFNLDEDLLSGAISSRTLAVAGVHMFGINMKSIENLKQKIPAGVFFIEDCAQSMGSATSGINSGSFGDVSFFSFNRGKNLPVYGGGCITTNNENIADSIALQVERLDGGNIFSVLRQLLKISAFSVAVNPLIYGLFFSLISRFKETAPQADFTAGRMSPFSAALGCMLMQKKEEKFSARHRNGMVLIEGLKGTKGLTLPKIPENTRYVFNRLPVIFKDAETRVAAAE